MTEQIKMPGIGLGTFKSEGNEVYNAVLDALKIGYKHIDTAAIYGNEIEIGKAIKDSKVLRSDIFVTTKIWNDVTTKEETINAFNESLEKLDMEYVDLLLIHWPKSKERNAQVWEALEQLEKEGRARAIGVSNFQIHHIEDLLETANVVPMINQVECHPHLKQINLQNYMEEKGIAMEAYGQFAKGNINDEVILKLAKKHNKTKEQIILRYLLQRNIFVIPKSVNKSRIEANINVNDFKLSMDEVNSINAINNATRYYPDPDNIGF